MAERNFTLGERVWHNDGDNRRAGTVTERNCDPPDDKKNLPGEWCRVEFDEGGSEVVNAVDLEPSESRSDQA